MPRLQLLIIALAVVLILLAGLDRGPQKDEPAPTMRGDDQAGEPDLIMQGAEISQFDATGALTYRIIAATITHIPIEDHTLLEEPRVTLYRDTEPPWELSARSGRIEGGRSMLDAGLARGADPTPSASASTGDLSDPRNAAERGGASEIVILEEQVVVRRERPGGGFIELSTSRLELFPGLEYASTDRPVIISAEAGRTRATGLRAELETGRLLLGPSETDRVRTTLFPDRLQ